MERLLRWDALDNTVEARAWKAQVEETLAETLDETFGPEASAAAPPMSRESLDDVIKAFTAYEAQNAQSE